jgi:hypothetical protein
MASINGRMLFLGLDKSSTVLLCSYLTQNSNLQELHLSGNSLGHVRNKKKIILVNREHEISWLKRHSRTRSFDMSCTAEKLWRDFAAWFS